MWSGCSSSSSAVQILTEAVVAIPFAYPIRLHFYFNLFLWLLLALHLLPPCVPLQPLSRGFGELVEDVRGVLEGKWTATCVQKEGYYG